MAPRRGVRRPSLKRASKRLKEASRFSAFNPTERIILHTLLSEHANTVSQNAATCEIGVGSYLAVIEALEAECGRA